MGVTITIRNKRTGETKRVTPEEALNTYGVPAETVSSKIKAEAEIEAASKGEDISLTAAEKTKAAGAKSANALVDTLEGRFTEAKGGEYTGFGAKVAGTKKNIMATLGLDNPATTYKRLSRGFTASLKATTGDTGVMTEQDYERIAGLMPKFTDDPEVAKNLFNDLRTLMAAKFGGEPAKSKYVQPETKGGVLEAVVPGLTELYKGKQKEVEEKGISSLPKQSLETLIPGLNLFEKGGTKAASEVLSILGGIDVTKNIINKGKGLVKNIFTDKVVPPQQTPDILNKGIKTATKGSTIRDKAISLAEESGEKVSGNTILKDVKSWAKDASRTASTSQKAQIDDFVSGVSKSLKGKEINPSTAKSIWDNANKGFSAAGKTGNTIEAGFNRAVRDGTRSALEVVAPRFGKGTSLIRQGLETEKIYGAVRKSIEKSAIKKSLESATIEPTKAIKTIRTVLKGAGISITTAALYAILFGKKK